MPRRVQDASQIVSVRLPDELMRRLDRYLDWRETARQLQSSRNAAIREALSIWLDE
jgi:metal-responsive CopG/Arc/MetJ family transcriptional regulator